MQYTKTCSTRKHRKHRVALVIMIVYRRLLTTHLHGKAAVVANKGDNFEVHDVTKYTRKH